MKKIIRKLVLNSLIILLMLSILNISQRSFAQEESDIDIIIKGKPLDMEEKPILKESKTYIPIRYFAEALDFKVEWLEAEKTVKLSNIETEIFIPVDKREIIINDEKLNLEEKSFIEKERSYIPLRSAAEILSQKVQWDEKNKMAIVGEFTSKEYIGASLEDKYEYTNDKYNFNIKIPNSLKDKLVIKEEEDGVRFFSKYNYELEKDFGILFTIIKTDNPEVVNIVPSNVLKYDNGSYYILVFASDVQYIVGDEKSTNEYMETLELSKEFIKSFELKENAKDIGENYNKIRDYMKKESIEAFSPYYELLDFQIFNYEEKEVDGNIEATFYYKIIEKNYDKDPDTVEYIKELKESGHRDYQQLYDEYLQPRESNFDLKIVVDKNDKITLYSNESPKGVKWVETKMDDYIIK